MIREAVSQDKEAVMALWLHAFGDTPEYMRLWFSKYYPKGKTLIMEDNQRILGALQLLPVHLTVNKKSHRGYYVGGVSVWEDVRHQKVGSLLMQAAAEHANRDQKEFCILIADVVGYYERFGYQPLSYRSVINSCPAGERIMSRPVGEGDENELLSLYRAFCKPYAAYQVRCAEDMLGAARLERSSRGNCVFLQESEEILAMVAYDTWKDTLFVDEALWKNERGKNLAIRFFHEFGKSKISVRCGELLGFSKGTPSVMMLPLGDWSFPLNGYYNIVV